MNERDKEKIETGKREVKWEIQKFRNFQNGISKNCLT